MATRAGIAASVAKAFSSSKGDVIRDGVLTRFTPSYNEDTGTATSTTATSNCRVLFDRASRTMSLYLTMQVVLPTDQPAWVAETSIAPAANDKIAVDGRTYSVVFAEDVVKAGSLHFVILR